MAETNSITDNPTHRELPKRLLFLLGIPFACFFVCVGIFYYFTSWPQYIELDITHPGYSGWDYTEKTVQVWIDSGDKFFIWRRETRVYGDCGGDFDSWALVIDYFDKWFAEHGWERAENQGDTPCNVYMPESNFLDIGVNGYAVYKHPNSQVYQWVPTVCLAVWPIDSELVEGFHVVLLTANPSPFTVLMGVLD
jgi:hypothetical protein